VRGIWVGPRGGRAAPGDRGFGEIPGRVAGEGALVLSYAACSRHEARQSPRSDPRRGGVRRRSLPRGAPAPRATRAGPRPAGAGVPSEARRAGPRHPKLPARLPSARTSMSTSPIATSRESLAPGWGGDRRGEAASSPDPRRALGSRSRFRARQAPGGGQGAGARPGGVRRCQSRAVPSPPAAPVGRRRRRAGRGRRAGGRPGRPSPPPSPPRAPHRAPAVPSRPQPPPADDKPGPGPPRAPEQAVGRRWPPTRRAPCRRGPRRAARRGPQLPAQGRRRRRAAARQGARGPTRDARAPQQAVVSLLHGTGVGRVGGQIPGREDDGRRCVRGRGWRGAAAGGGAPPPPPRSPDGVRGLPPALQTTFSPRRGRGWRGRRGTSWSS